MKCPTINQLDVIALGEPVTSNCLWKKKFFEKTPFFDQKTKILTNFLRFLGKMPVGISS